jgi:hypothetical protein
LVIAGDDGFGDDQCIVRGLESVGWLIIGFRHNIFVVNL